MTETVKAKRARLRLAREAALQERRAALVTLGYPKAGGARALVWESTAIKIMRWSRAKLRRLPHQLVPNPHHLSGAKARLYDPLVLLDALGPLN